MAPIWQALYDAGAEVVLSGHDHDYERFAPQDAAGNADAATGSVSSSSGRAARTFEPIDDRVPNSEVSDSSTFGVLKLTLRPDGYDWQFMPAAGGSFTDAGSASAIRLRSCAAAEESRPSSGDTGRGAAPARRPGGGIAGP